MALDTSMIARAAQEAMAGWEADPEYEEGTIVAVGITVEMLRPDPDAEPGEEGGELNTTPVFCTNPSRVYQYGLFSWAVGTIESGDPGEDAPPPGEG